MPSNRFAMLTRSFLAGMGSVLFILPGVLSPVREEYDSYGFVTAEAYDAAAVAGYWGEIGGDVAEALQGIAQPA